MSTGLILKTTSTGLNATLDLAAKLGRQLRGSEVIELVSDLGGGKTSFVKGLARGMGSDDMVHSPSFTISNVYETGSLRLYHFDFYRLADPGIMRDELAEVLTDPAAVVAIEWADSVHDVLPVETVTVTIENTGDTTRDITIALPKARQYLRMI